METLEGLKKEVERLTLKMGQLEESHDKELLETEHRYSLEIERLTLERDEYKRLAESWMADYDKMVAKYEPTFAVTSEAKRQGEPAINYGTTDKLKPDEFAPENVIEPAKCEHGTLVQHRCLLCEDEKPASAGAPREWWIRTIPRGRDAKDDFEYGYIYYSKTEDAIHVIEKSAYDSLKNQHKSLRAAQDLVIEKLKADKADLEESCDCISAKLGETEKERDSYRKQCEKLVGALVYVSASVPNEPSDWGDLALVVEQLEFANTTISDDATKAKEALAEYEDFIERKNK